MNDNDPDADANIVDLEKSDRRARKKIWATEKVRLRTRIKELKNLVVDEKCRAVARD